jgi:signal transduction histidine kinase
VKASLDLDSQSWRIAIVAVSGLLLGILVAGVVGLALNASVAEVAARAQAYDVRLEDLGDDLRLTVLELRTHQRELALLGRTDDTVGAWEQAYARLDQAVQGLELLVDNAAKYSPRGASVALNASTVGGELRIDVIDRGPGIPPADLPRVFDRFYRVEQQPAGRSESQQGLGLGLAIARTILEAHGGRIEATSRLGAGTHMRCTLPLAQPAHARTAPRPEQARATS